MMICRIWHGWTTWGNADTYETIVRGEVIPGIEARKIRGFRRIDLLRREFADEVEFLTMMWFDDLDAIRAFVGDEYTIAHVPIRARAVLTRFDAHSMHYEVIDRREQMGT